MKIFDQHVHSYYSFDSQQSIREYLKKATELSLDYFVLTDHFDLNYLSSNKDISFSIEDEQKELDNFKSEFPNIKILNGIEIGYTKCSLNRTSEIVKKYSFDLINLSVHEDGKIDYYYADGFNEFGIEETLKQYFNLVLESIKVFPDYDVVCHIDFGFKTAYLLDKSLKLEQFEKEVCSILKEIIARDKTLELNVKVQEFINDAHTLYLLKLYKKLGGKNLTLSSDAHRVDRFCSKFNHYINLIKEAGFDHLNYFVARKRFDCKI